MDVAWILLALAAAALLGLVPATIARRKGRSFGWWWIFGALTWIVAMVAVLLVSDTRTAPSSSRSSP